MLMNIHAEKEEKNLIVHEYRQSQIIEAARKIITTKGIQKLTVGNIEELIQGKDTHFGRELIRNVGRYFRGSSIWYLRLAFERAVLDRLQEQIDPGAKDTGEKKRKEIITILITDIGGDQARVFLVIPQISVMY